jgi:hypothetical protein
MDDPIRIAAFIWLQKQTDIYGDVLPRQILVNGSNHHGDRTDFIIRVREDVLLEIDGLMLRYGLQSLENTRLILPVHKKDWPDRERLENRFERFLKAG